MAKGKLAASLLEKFRALPRDVQRHWLNRYGEDAVLAMLAGAGALRPPQLAPAGDWGIWVILAGRGFGKTRAGAQWVHDLAAAGGRRFALVAPSLDTARAVMVEGESGLFVGAVAAGSTPDLATGGQAPDLVQWQRGAALFRGGARRPARWPVRLCLGG